MSNPNSHAEEAERFLGEAAEWQQQGTLWQGVLTVSGLGGLIVTIAFVLDRR